MRAIGKRWLTIGGGMLALAAVFATANCSKACTEAGCQSGAFMSLDLPTTPDTLVGQTVTICRNTACYSTSLPAISPVGSTVRIAFAGTSQVDGELSLLPDQSTRLRLAWRNLGGAQPPSADQFTVGLTDATGASTIVLDKPATYQRLSPNGDDCGPICWYADL